MVHDGSHPSPSDEHYRTFSPSWYWLPLLGAFSGARMNELAQLCLEDVYQAESGTWVVSFNDNAPDKRLKNAASRRLLPVHPRLIELGLDRWAKALRGAGHTRLFPELPYDQGKGYSKAAVKQFSAYMARLGYKSDGKLTFHSFRHTFVNRLPDATPEQGRRRRRPIRSPLKKRKKTPRGGRGRGRSQIRGARSGCFFLGRTKPRSRQEDAKCTGA